MLVCSLLSHIDASREMKEVVVDPQINELIVEREGVSSLRINLSY